MIRGMCSTLTRDGRNRLSLCALPYVHVVMVAYRGRVMSVRGRCRDEIERRTERDDRLALQTHLEFCDESGEVGDDPGMQVGRSRRVRVPWGR